MSLLDRLRGGRAAPEAIRRELTADEVVLGLADADDGTQLAVTRSRLLVARPGGETLGLSWYEIGKAVLADGSLKVTVLQRLGEFAGSGDVVCDAATLEFVLGRANRLTDQVHHRVRRSVAAARHLPWPGAGGWVTIRRVAGQDGLLPQLRMDSGGDPLVPGFLDAAELVLADLRRSPDTRITGVDD